MGIYSIEVMCTKRRKGKRVKEERVKDEGLEGMKACHLNFVSTDECPLQNGL